MQSTTDTARTARTSADVPVCVQEVIEGCVDTAGFDAFRQRPVVNRAGMTVGLRLFASHGSASVYLREDGDLVVSRENAWGGGRWDARFSAATPVDVMCDALFSALPTLTLEELVGSRNHGAGAEAAR